MNPTVENVHKISLGKGKCSNGKVMDV